MREYFYTVDLEGRIFHDGSEITDPAVLRFFLLGMRQAADGRYHVPCQGERNWFHAQDTPFVVRRVVLRPDSDGASSIVLIFAGGYEELLDPATLEVQRERVYCHVRKGAFRARFGRLAVQQLGERLVETDAGLALVLGGAHYPIRHV